MKDGFIKIAAATSDIKVADTDYNAEKIERAISEAHENGAKIIVCHCPLMIFGVAQIFRNIHDFFSLC